MRLVSLLVLASFSALAAGCDAGPVGDKAAADNRAFQEEEDGGFFSSWLGRRKEPAGFDPGVPGQCRFTAWAANTAPAGTPIHAGPGRTFDTVGKLPAARATEAGLNGIEAATFQVVEARDGWFRIAKPVFQRLDFDEEPVVYPDGWIDGKHLSFALQSDFAFERPDPRSAKVASSWNDPTGPNTLRFHSPQDCQGEWVKLTVSGYDGVEKPGWVRGACGKLETACEGLVSDNPARPADLPTYPAPAPVAAPKDVKPSDLTPSATASAKAAKPAG